MIYGLFIGIWIGCVFGGLIAYAWFGMPKLSASDRVSVTPNGALLFDCRELTDAALRTIKAYQDERDAQFRTLRQRARSRRKRPVR